jgi:glucose-1-phosphate cytidylyltransferase
MEVNDNGQVIAFKEKAHDDCKWINGGFFVLKPDVFKYLDGDMKNIMWEDIPLERLTTNNELVAYRHKGFWKCMDALRDKIELEELWKNNEAKWKVW